MTEIGGRHVAIALSAAIHAVVLWWYGDSLWESHKPSAELPAIVAHLSLVQESISPAVSPAAVQESMQKSELLAKVETKTMLPKQQGAIQAITPTAEVLRPVTEEQKSHEPISPDKADKEQQEDVIETAEVIEPAPNNIESQASSHPVVETATLVHAETDEEQAVQELQRYLAALRASITANKHYPAIARRRGIEGKVKVSFLLLANGDIRELRVSGGPKPLRLAAKRAVDKALRFPSPPAHAPTPLPVQYAMNFSLQ